MSKIIGFLFPWRNTYRRLELHKRWWHRLATVLFFIALVPALLFSWGIADDANSPTNQFDSDITYWERTTSGTLLSFDPSSPPPVDLSSLGAVPQAPANIPPPPPGYSIVPTPIAQKTIRMPNGETVTYPGTTPDATIGGDWEHQRHLATLKAGLLGFGWAVLATLIFSYLLQAAYRALVYVIYGAKAGPTPDAPIAQ